MLQTEPVARELAPAERPTFAALRPVNVESRALFPTPVMIAQIEGAADLNDALIPLILAREAEEDGVLNSNDGGWQSADDFAGWGGGAGTALLRVAGELATAITVVDRDQRLSRQALAWKFNAWANVNRFGQGNHFHCHGGAFWSGVYYVDDGLGGGGPALGGAFEMMDPRGIAPRMYAPALRVGLAGCVSAGQAEQIQPRTGQLMLFPSWLYHGVTRYLGQGTRISVAFNLMAF